MTDTLHLGLPTLAAAQAQKHVTLNAALQRLDTLVMLAVLDRDVTAPPASPAAGDRYLVKAPATGAFAGKVGQIAHFVDGGWDFYPPSVGWLCYVLDEGVLIAWHGGGWQAISGGGSGGGGAGGELQNLVLLGLGTTADAVNPLSAKLNNALWAAKTVAEGGDGTLRFKMNKESAAKTVSLLFQDAWSGRAEIGLTGDDDFHFKVSPDGSAWLDAILIDRTTGKVSLPLTGSPASNRNRLLNGNFGVDQRGVSGTVTLAAGAYGHDRWKAGAGGCSYTFAGSGIDTVITITSGTLCQVIEDKNVEGGVYTASWTGTAQGRVWQGSPAGSYQASGFATGNLTAAVNTAIEFGTGTLTRVQIEPGTVATAFERRFVGDELRRCQRYFYRVASPGWVGAVNGATIVARLGGPHPVQMRAAPTVTLGGTITLFDNATIASMTGITENSSTVDYVEITGTMTAGLTVPRTAKVINYSAGYFDVSAEL